MDIQLENLKMLPRMLEIIEMMKEELSNIHAKRWLNVKELAEYLGYSKDRIYKLKAEHLIEGIHFYNRTGKILFDRVAIDSWVVGKDDRETDRTRRQVVDHVLSSIKEI